MNEGLYLSLRFTTMLAGTLGIPDSSKDSHGIILDGRETLKACKYISPDRIHPIHFEVETEKKANITVASKANITAIST